MASTSAASSSPFWALSSCCSPIASFAADRTRRPRRRRYRRPGLLTDDKVPARQGCAPRIGHDDLPLSFQGRRHSLAGVYAPTIAADPEGNYGHRLSAALPAVEYRLPRKIAKLGIEHDALLLPRRDHDGRVDGIALEVSGSGRENDARDLATQFTRTLDRPRNCHVGLGSGSIDARCRCPLGARTNTRPRRRRLRPGELGGFLHLRR